MAAHKCLQVDKIQRMEDKFDSIEEKLAVLVDLKDDIKANSEFRIQSKGVIGFVAFLFTAFGAGIFWLFSLISS
ncbi:unnamed protein product [marine sediment metagenome]|uniref:Uncharacterized protein n=1 Tax=marine sediment metagenome TaxID=412755 RepID=X1AAC7_9ZZZZ